MMRTAVLQAPRRFEVAERPTPRPGRGAALVRVAATAVCHTDLSIYTGRHPGVRYPVVLGHEATGVVEAVGPDVRIPVGARVVINPIVAVSRSAWKRDLARRMRADATVDPSGRDVVAEVLGLTGGHGADLVIDTTGDPRLVGSAMEMLRPGGVLLLYAISHEPVQDFTTFPMYVKELTLVGSRALVPADFEPAVRLVATGAVELDGLITGSYPLHRAAAAFGDYERDPDHVLRLLIVP